MFPLYSENWQYLSAVTKALSAKIELLHHFGISRMDEGRLSESTLGYLRLHHMLNFVKYMNKYVKSNSALQKVSESCMNSQLSNKNHKENI